ncbi:DUF5933 domain-containing protein, partial [Streptomyces sp. NPDC001215]
MLWTAAGVVTLGFLIALEIAARNYGLPGPIASQAPSRVIANTSSGPLTEAD